jgi:vacuolar-type H+-ATPase catalytic subunit A/Vma1
MDYASLIRFLKEAEEALNKAAGDAVAVKNEKLHNDIMKMCRQARFLQVYAMKKGVETDSEAFAEIDKLLKNQI